eukprot:TRINITY_DN122767_c0_g1_i1.p1 TRINITY_DN122767_c0_g1~~TRINITY_DN122767_c0_g1_i1.p1  ORF type:complete len:748 (+),score=172.04 TRINITY_DN122767_c0_g1_i1:102-2345(+)
MDPMNYAPYNGGDYSVSAAGAADAFMNAHSPHEVSQLSTGLASSLMLGKMSWDLALPKMLSPAFSSTLGTAAAGLSAVAGVAAAKKYLDHEDTVYARRLTEVRTNAPLLVPPAVALTDVTKQLVASLTWALEAEEDRPDAVQASLGVFAKDDSKRGFRRQQRRIWETCRMYDAGPARATGSSSHLPLSRRLRRSEEASSSRESRARETYERLFHAGMTRPGTQSFDLFDDGRAFDLEGGPSAGERRLCAALCYLVSAFLDLRLKAPGSLNDAERSSLRLAATSLASAKALDSIDNVASFFAPAAAAGAVEAEDPEVDLKVEWSGRTEFLRCALLILCYLDTALAWRPMDPLGLMGSCDEGVGVVLPRGARYLCTYKLLASNLVKSLQSLRRTGCLMTWRRLRVHLDAMRQRELPDPWPCVWATSKETSMLVKNRTKVHLRVEVYRGNFAMSSPLADWPLLQKIYCIFFPADDGFVMEGEVGPGYEWALRPPRRSGQQFQLRLLTEAGVVVCKKRLRRGQTLDFDVKIPSRPKKSVVISEGVVRNSDIETRSKDKGSRSSKFSVSSLPSTAVPSTEYSYSSMATGSADLAAGLGSSLPRHDEEAVDEKPGFVQQEVSRIEHWKGDSAAAVGGLSVSSLAPIPSSSEARSEQTRIRRLTTINDVVTALCPRCLREMSERHRRPAAKIYAEGVRCDHCSEHLVNERGVPQTEEKFFHCGRCWFDLCRSCAVREMQTVWWNEDDDDATRQD